MDQLLKERELILRDLRAELISSRMDKTALNLTYACEAIENVRMYSLMIIENMCKLRRKHRIEVVPYISEIIDRICLDTDFLRFSPLRKNIEFANCDPLFLSPFHKFWNLSMKSDYNRRPVINLFTIDPDYKERLLNA